MGVTGNVKIFSGNAHPALAEEICGHLSCDLGKAVNEFRAYRVDQTFNEGDLIRHKKFGDGVVTRILDPKKVEILFKDEPRTLAQGLTD